MEILNEIGANDNYRHTVARSLLPVDEPFVQQYVQATSSPLHKFKLQVESVFQIESAKDKDFKGFANHKLLWYGTSPENVYSTLRDGFSLNSEDGSFGNKALYFTGIHWCSKILIKIFDLDCATKAANYTSADGGKFSGAADTGDVSPGFDQTGYLFLAEVSLGRGNEYSEANPNARLLLNGADSVYGRGSYRPDGE